MEKELNGYLVSEIIDFVGKGNEKYQKCGQGLCFYQTDSVIVQKCLQEMDSRYDNAGEAFLKDNWA